MFSYRGTWAKRAWCAADQEKTNLNRFRLKRIAGATMAVPVGRRAARITFLGRLRRIFASVVILVLLALGAALLNNNVSIQRPSRADFVDNLDQTLDRSTEWTFRQYQQTATGSPTPEGRSLLSNSATAHMIVDCASLSREPSMKALGSSFVDAWKVEASAFSKVVDPAIPMNAPSERELQSLEEYQRWLLHGAAPNDIPLSPKELDDMFSPRKYRTGEATHQLLALHFYRKSKGSTPELDRLMQTIEERISWEAAIDFRVTDLYLQRVAFLLAADRPDLVRPRWVERAFAAQQTNGGWLKTWHGWTRTPYRFSFHDELPNAHSTAQGMWISCMLKYRYPEWIEQNYK
jgi:hypothetical protein